MPQQFEIKKLVVLESDPISYAITTHNGNTRAVFCNPSRIEFGSFCAGIYGQYTSEDAIQLKMNDKTFISDYDTLIVQGITAFPNRPAALAALQALFITEEPD